MPRLVDFNTGARRYVFLRGTRRCISSNTALQRAPGGTAAAVSDAAGRSCRGRWLSVRMVAFAAIVLALHYLDKLVLGDTGLTLNGLPVFLGLAPAIVAALVGGGANLLGNVFSGFSSRAAQEDANRANKELAQYQYAKDLEMWQRANAYNHPSQQMARLRQAGLNENMVYGNGGAVTVGASQLPRYSAPDIKALPPVLSGNAIGEAISQYQDIMVKNQQVDLLSEQTENVRRENAALAQFVFGKRAAELGYEGKALTVREAMWRERLEAAGYKAKNEGQEYEKRRSLDWLKMPTYQRQALESQNSKRAVEMQKLGADTQLTRKKIEFFAAEAILGMFGQFSRGLSGLKKAGSAKAGKGATGGAAPRVTPKTEFGRIHPAYRVRNAKFNRK